MWGPERARSRVMLGAHVSRYTRGPPPLIPKFFYFLFFILGPRRLSLLLLLPGRSPVRPSVPPGARAFRRVAVSLVRLFGSGDGSTGACQVSKSFNAAPSPPPLAPPRFVFISSDYLNSI
ncbi:hypothetical protein BT93_A2341 [Corymbia citriodora subsp. variegata]|nr:hypothetical protein BT93_A2341 [Corymbia citriodora subsp. variegata]